MMLAATLAGCEREAPRQPCTVEQGGQTWFIGSGKCMLTLPEMRMSGVWVVGHESSIFYPDASLIPQEAGNPEKPGDEAAKVWLSTEPTGVAELLQQHGFKFDGNPHAFRVDFVGTKSDQHGVYGYAGVFRHGVLVKRIISIHEIPID